MRDASLVLALPPGLMIDSRQSSSKRELRFQWKLTRAFAYVDRPRELNRSLYKAIIVGRNCMKFWLSGNDFSPFRQNFEKIEIGKNITIA